MRIFSTAVLMVAALFAFSPKADAAHFENRVVGIDLGGNPIVQSVLVSDNPFVFNAGGGGSYGGGYGGFVDPLFAVRVNNFHDFRNFRDFNGRVIHDRRGGFRFVH